MLLQQLSKLINIVKSHIRTYLNKIFELIHNLWDDNTYILIMMNAIRYNNMTSTQTTKQLNNNNNNIIQDNNGQDNNGKDNKGHNDKQSHSSSLQQTQQKQQKQSQFNVYNGYHPYYNHPSSNLASATTAIINQSRYSFNSNDGGLNVNLFQHVRNRSDSFGPFGGHYHSSPINYPSLIIINLI